jgi:hypothetical protein
MTMTLEWEQTNVDSNDPVSLGRWWQQALQWVVVNEAPDEFEIRPAPDRLPGLLFVPVPEAKTVKIWNPACARVSSDPRANPGNQGGRAFERYQVALEWLSQGLGAD